MDRSRLAMLAGIVVAFAGTAAAQDYKAPRNGMGQPDFSGAWTNESLTPFREG